MRRGSLQFEAEREVTGYAGTPVQLRRKSGKYPASYGPGAAAAPAAAPRPTAWAWRAAAMLLHRWVGLSLAVFLVVAGATGTVLAFYGPLDALLNPELHHVAPPAPGARLLEPLALYARVQEQLPEGVDLGPVLLDVRERRSVSYWIVDREAFVDPYTGNILGSRRPGELGQGLKGVLPFVYRLHHSLGLGEAGIWLFGVVALLWSLDCFVGAYLTFPVQGPAAAARTPWLQRWAPAWLLKGNQLFSLVFTWHRASGLWLWGVLLVFAWSAVALNLPGVYDAAMSKLVAPAPHTDLQPLASPRAEPRLAPRAALELGRQLARARAREQGFAILGERALSYDAEYGAYWYRLESTLDIDGRVAETTLVLDGDDGRPLQFSAPTTQGTRYALDRWLVALHFGAVRQGGMAYRVFVALVGVLLVLLSSTGVWVWWRKRCKRARHRLALAVERAPSERAVA